VSSVPAPRFLADAMLERLARWLRVLDHDTAAPRAGEADALLVRQAAAEDRVLLTRDRRLLRDLRPARALEITSAAPLEQLRHVVTTLALLPPPGLFRRCLVCNVPLSAPLAPETAAGVVPARALSHAGPVRRCARCGRHYWQGSHARRMRLALERALPGWLPPAADGSAPEG
jgi:hypothetical protein